MGEQGGALPNFGAPGSEQKLPTMEELLEAIENMKDLPEDSKQELRESILRGALGRQAENLVDAAAEQAGAASAGGYGGVGEITVLLILISVVFLILVFFGYKLYSSLMEKERRREEKRKQKQQKKKK